MGVMGVEAMPVIGFRHRIPGPVRLLCIDKNDPSVRICVVVVGPDIIAPRRRATLCVASTLKPRMLIGGVIDYQLGDDPDITWLGTGNDPAEVSQGTVTGMYPAVVGDVVSVIARRRRVERQQPDRVSSEARDVIKLLQQARKVAEPVVVRVKERFYMKLIDDRVFVPERVGRDRRIAFLSKRVAPATGRIRQIANGSVAGSRRICCIFPCQMKVRSPIRSSTATAAASDRPKSHSGTSMSHSCGKCGSRLTATKTTFCRSVVALE